MRPASNSRLARGAGVEELAAARLEFARQRLDEGERFGREDASVFGSSGLIAAANFHASFQVAVYYLTGIQ